MSFCGKVGIQTSPWIWEKNPEMYESLNDFFSRKYKVEHSPPLGKESVVSPACCKLSVYKNEDGLRDLLVKGCSYKFEAIGIPSFDESDFDMYKRNHVMIGYLAPADYHRVHCPISGKCIHLQLEDKLALSASVKFFGGKFNILNNNKRLVVVIEKAVEGNKCNIPLRVALVVIGGVGVNTIQFDQNILNRHVDKGEEISTFLAGGSAFALFSNKELNYNKHLLQSTGLISAPDGDFNIQERSVEVLVGEGLAWAS